MREPSREAREAGRELRDNLLAGGWITDTFSPEPIARALDDFAEKWREEVESFRREAKRLGEKLGRMKVWRSQEQSRADKAEQERDALRRRVAELEAEVETERILVRAAQEAAQEQKARAEAAEAALEGCEGTLQRAAQCLHDLGKTQASAACRVRLEEARRARGET